MADKEKSMFTKAKEAMLGTPEQNKKAAAEMKEQDKKKPDSAQAKINKMTNYGGYKKGGMAMKHEDVKMDKKTVKKAVGMHESQLHGGKKSNLTKLKSGGCAKMVKGGGIEKKGKSKGRMC